MRDNGGSHLHLKGNHTMKKELGTIQALFPMPVLVIAAYDAGGTIQTMNAAWGQICDTDKIALFLDEDHATTKAIRETKAFTVALADRARLDAIAFDQFRHGYYATGEKAGQAWNAGSALAKAALAATRATSPS